jgi:hypothetical protein
MRREILYETLMKSISIESELKKNLHEAYQGRGKWATSFQAVFSSYFHQVG